MADTQAMPAEALARIIYKLDPTTGEPIRLETDGSTDGSVFLMTGNKVMSSTMGPTFNTQPAISTDSYTRAAVDTVNGAEATWVDVPNIGAMELYAELLKGWVGTKDGSGNVIALSIEDAATAECNTWTTSASTSSRFGALELVGWRYCDNEQDSVRMNIFREISEATPSANLQAGLVDPGSSTSGNINLKLISNDGWLATAGDAWFNALFPMFSDDAGAVGAANPGTFGLPVGTESLFDELINLCACNNGVRGIPLTAALVLANPELDTPLIINPV